nr:senescence/dehydration-associated protein [Quercus suber]
MAPLKAIEEVLIKILGAILNLIDKHYSVELAWVISQSFGCEVATNWPARSKPRVKLCDLSEGSGSHGF